MEDNQQTAHQDSQEHIIKDNKVQDVHHDASKPLESEKIEEKQATVSSENNGVLLDGDASSREREDSIKQLIEFGFDEGLARKALEQTKDIEEAINLILVFQDNQSLEGPGGVRAPTKDQVKELAYKMVPLLITQVIVVRNDLKMKPGKVAAQVGHGVLGAYKIACRQYPQDVQAWEEIGQMKVVVRCESEKELLDVYNHALKAGIAAEYIKDAGRTQVAPGSITVCAVGPGRADLVDQVTGHLKLY